MFDLMEVTAYLGKVAEILEESKSLYRLGGDVW
jgi:hypothetical protein